jgi:hypothetical protein
MQQWVWRMPQQGDPALHPSKLAPLQSDPVPLLHDTERLSLLFGRRRRNLEPHRRNPKPKPTNLKPKEVKPKPKQRRPEQKQQQPKRKQQQPRPKPQQPRPNPFQAKETPMTLKTNSTHRALAILKLPAKMPVLITYASNMAHAMQGNPAFPTPTPPLATVTAAIADLQVAETAVLARAHGAVATRDLKRAALVVLLQELRGYVQSTADADPENAPAIIQSAGIPVRQTPVRAARTFAATPGLVSGSAKLVAASASRRAGYEWQYSTDGGKTWVAAPFTLQAKTTVSGLQPGSTVQFRYRPVTKTGEGDWSQSASLLVK